MGGRTLRAAPAIAVLVSQFPDLSQTFVANEIRAVRRAGRRVRVESRSRARRPNPEIGDEFPVAFAKEDTRASRLLAVLWLAARHPVRVLSDLRERRRWAREEAVAPLRALATVARRLRRERIGHLHVHFAGPVALDALRLGRILELPYSVTAHAYEIYGHPRNLAEKLERAAFATSGCDYTVRDLQAVVAPEHRSRIHRIIMGVDAADFSRRSPYPGGRTVLAVGRLVEKKGFCHLIDAAALLDRNRAVDRIVIVGEGPERERLEAQRARLGLDDLVELLGAQPPSAIHHLLERADALAMPCVVAADGDRDSMPVVVKEALAMEVPVVCSAEVGLPELVRDEWGRLVPPGDPDALAAALEELLALPPAKRASMGRAGRAFVLEECNVDTEARRLLALIDGAPLPRP